MIGINDTISEITTVDDMKEITTFAKEKNLAAVHIWSFDRDTPCDLESSVLPTCSGPTSKTGALKPLDFSNAVIDIINK
ncbi:MAG: hypothetical protein O2809_06375 [Proteobacteria bacterium]|nr:hypothetical protein [Pseudomonadota bacterium]